MNLGRLIIAALTLTLNLAACEQQAPPEAPGSAHDEITSPIKPHTLSQLSAPATEPTLSPPLALAQKSGCLNCHAVDHKIIGPPWQEVSKRYAGDEGARSHLIKKVKTGGSGNWTEITGGVVMPAYGGRVSEQDIEILVDFVLSLTQQPQ
ncbi:MAG: c-type cytochrome [Gammaproteobacteria bacterium]|nr:c-type cytochrome [Gammaproteobacteria bacterium]